MKVERRCKLRGGGFREYVHDVVERRDPVESEMSPAGVFTHIEDAGKPFFLLLVSQVSAIPAQFAPDQRMAMGRTGSA